MFLILAILGSCGSSPVVKKPVVKKPKKIILKRINYRKTGRLIKASAVYTGSNSMAAIADTAGQISLYSLPSLTFMKTIPAGSSRLTGIVFHNRGNNITAAYADSTVVTFKVKGYSTAAVLQRKGKYGQIRCIAAHPSRNRILLGNGSGEVIQFSNGEKEPVRKKTGLKSVNYILYSPDGKKIALAGRRNILTMDSDGLDRDEKIRTGSPVISFAFSRDSKMLATGTLFFRILLFKTKSLDMKSSYEISMDPVSSLLFRHREKWLIAGSGKTGRGTLHILSLPQLKLKKIEKLDMEEIIRLESLAGGLLLAISSDGTLLLLKPVF